MAPEPTQPTPRPDRGRGVFETLLVVGGEPVELEAHMRRMAAALRALYGQPPPAGLAADIRAAAAGRELARLRATVARRGHGGPVAEIAVEDVDAADVLPGWDRAVELVSFALPGGLGPYKWADRRLLDRATAALGPRQLLLIADERGRVLETARANVFAVQGGSLLTPPPEGRALPGIARERAIQAARAAGVEVREQGLSAADLRAAGEVLLTGSVRCVEPVRALDGEPLRPPGEIAATLGRALRELWLGGRALAATA